jgi:hypothetical protein
MPINKTLIFNRYINARIYLDTLRQPIGEKVMSADQEPALPRVKTKYDTAKPYLMFPQVLIGGLAAGVTALLVAKIMGNFETEPVDAIYKDYRLYINAVIAGIAGAGGFAASGSIFPTVLDTFRDASLNDTHLTAKLIFQNIFNAFFSKLNLKFFAAGSVTFIAFLLASPLILTIIGEMAPNSPHNIRDLFFSGIDKGAAGFAALLIFILMAWATNIPPEILDNLALSQIAASFLGFQVGGGIAARSDSTAEQLLVPPILGGALAIVPPAATHLYNSTKWCASRFFNRPRNNAEENWDLLSGNRLEPPIEELQRSKPAARMMGDL